MNILKQSTAATIKFGPMIDDSDGKTAETTLTISQADIRLSKNGGDFAQTNNATGATHDENGYYDIPLNATDTGTLGRLRVAVSKLGALPVWQDFVVITANVYDTLCSTDNFEVTVTALADDTIKASTFDESTAFPLKSADTGSTQVARVGADSDTLETLSDQLDAAALEATLTAIKGAGWTSENLTAMVNQLNNYDNEILPGGDLYTIIDSIVTHLTQIKGTGWTDETLVALMTAIEAITGYSTLTAQQVWEYVTRTLTDPNSYKADVSGLAPAGEYDTELTAIQADLNNPDQYKADISGIPAAVWSYATRTLSSFGTLVADIWTHVTRTLSAFGFTVATNSDANVTAIKLKTDNLPASPAATGEYDAELAAIQADLDNADQYKADVSGLAQTTHLQEVEDKVDAIGIDVDNVGAGMATPATVWAYPDRTLTVSSVKPRTLVDGDQFTIYKDTSIKIPFGKLGDISAYTNLLFTVKREQDLELGDDQSIIHMDKLTGLLYLNKAAAVAGQGSIVILDAVTGSIDALITKDGGALLPVYAKERLRWEVKGISGAAVDILLQGTCFIEPAVSRKIA